MQQQKAVLLVAPALQNSSCSHPRYANVGFLTGLGPGDVLQALIVFLLTFGVLAANLLLILVINSRRYSKYIHSQVCKDSCRWEVVYFPYEFLLEKYSVFRNVAKKKNYEESIVLVNILTDESGEVCLRRKVRNHKPL